MVSHATWLDLVGTAHSAADLREGLAARFPAFAAGALKECVVVGAAVEGERFCSIAPALGVKIHAVVDQNPALLGRSLAGGIAVTPAIPESLSLDVPVIIASHRVLRATQRLTREGRRNVIGLGVLQTIDPKRFPPQAFYEHWLDDLVAHCDQYRKVYAMLADETSRALFDAILGYRVSGNINLLAPYVDDILFYPQDLFNLGSDEVYLDGGAFAGDTIELFVERTAGRFKRVIAFEPDPENFMKLAKRFSGEPRIEPRNLGLFSDRRELRFASAGGRASGLSDEGDVVVGVTSIDLELDGAPATFIKLNIEGAELEALSGAKETLRRWKPKLCVSGYHKASHLWEVPLTIQKICPDYKIYLRQHDGGVIESTYYGLH